MVITAQNRDNFYDIWLMMQKESRQIIAFHLEDIRFYWKKYLHKLENMDYSQRMIEQL